VRLLAVLLTATRALVDAMVESIGGESFQTYVEKVLVPTLRPGDIVIMDNLGSHKGPAAYPRGRR
jgi:hypothetical protein